MIGEKLSNLWVKYFKEEKQRDIKQEEGLKFLYLLSCSKPVDQLYFWFIKTIIDLGLGKAISLAISETVSKGRMIVIGFF